MYPSDGNQSFVEGRDVEMKERDMDRQGPNPAKPRHHRSIFIEADDLDTKRLVSSPLAGSFSSSPVTPDYRGDEKDFGPKSRFSAYDETEVSSQELPSRYPWKPGFASRFPWLGFGAIFCNVLFTCIAVLVLLFSNNTDIQSWRLHFQPSVVLSILSTLASQALSLALTQGIIIAFWRRAVNGTTLGELHRRYEEGINFLDALSGLFYGIFHGRSIVMALACIFVTLSSIRSPMMQRASTVVPISEPVSGNMTVQAAQTLADYADALGEVTGRTHAVSYLTKNFTDIVRNYTNREDIFISADKCGDKCTTSIKGFGFMPNCTTWDVPMDTTGNGTSFWRGNIFTVETSVNTGDYYTDTSASLFFNVTYAEKGISSKSLRFHQCDLYPGIMEYPVMITDGTVTLQGTWESDKLVAPLVLLAPNYGGTVIGGFSFFFDQQFTSSVSAYFGGGAGWIFSSTGSLGTQYTNIGGSYSTTTSDPMSAMMSQVREVAFRTAIQTPRNHPALSEDSNGVMQNFTQLVTYNGEQMHNVFRSDFRIMILAVLVNCVGLVAVLPLFYGWWELGRKMSLSPLEIANAFEAPLLRGVEGNAEHKHIVGRVGGIKIRYGEGGGSSRGFGEDDKRFASGAPIGIGVDRVRIFEDK